MFVSVGCRTATVPVPPDVILIVVDTLRADHVSVYGYPRRTAPALEQFARDAVCLRRRDRPAPGRCRLTPRFSRDVGLPSAEQNG